MATNATARAAAFLVLVGLIVLAPRAAWAQCDCPAEDATVIGHRGAGTSGASAMFVENTIASAREAITQGATMVEIDVQLSGDGTVVLMHDGTVDRTTSGTGCVSALTDTELASLDVPTLESFLADYDAGLNIEIKVQDPGACGTPDVAELVDSVAARIAADPLPMRELIVSSFDLPALQRLRSVQPTTSIGYLSGDASDIDVCEAEGFEAIHLLSAAANRRAMTRARAANVRVNVFTVNDPSEMRRLFDLDVDGVITDEAARAVSEQTAFCAAFMCPTDAGAPDAGSAGVSGGGCAVRRDGSGEAALFVPVLLWLTRRRWR